MVENIVGTNRLIDNNYALNNTHRLKTVQNREITSNNLKLNKLQNDILTANKQTTQIAINLVIPKPPTFFSAGGA